MATVDNFILEQGRHNLMVDENGQVSRGEKGGLLVYDNISKYFSDIMN